MGKCASAQYEKPNTEIASSSSTNFTSSSIKSKHKIIKKTATAAATTTTSTIGSSNTSNVSRQSRLNLELSETEQRIISNNNNNNNNINNENNSVTGSNVTDKNIIYKSAKSILEEFSDIELFDENVIIEIDSERKELNEKKFQKWESFDYKHHCAFVACDQLCKIFNKMKHGQKIRYIINDCHYTATKISNPQNYGNIREVNEISKQVQLFYPTSRDAKMTYFEFENASTLFSDDDEYADEADEIESTEYNESDIDVLEADIYNENEIDNEAEAIRIENKENENMAFTMTLENFSSNSKNNNDIIGVEDSIDGNIYIDDGGVSSSDNDNNNDDDDDVNDEMIHLRLRRSSSNNNNNNNEIVELPTTTTRLTVETGDSGSRKGSNESNVSIVSNNSSSSGSSSSNSSIESNVSVSNDETPQMEQIQQRNTMNLNMSSRQSVNTIEKLSLFNSQSSKIYRNNNNNNTLKPLLDNENEDDSDSDSGEANTCRPPDTTRMRKYFQYKLAEESENENENSSAFDYGKMYKNCDSSMDICQNTADLCDTMMEMYGIESKKKNTKKRALNSVRNKRITNTSFTFNNNNDKNGDKNSKNESNAINVNNTGLKLNDSKSHGSGLNDLNDLNFNKTTFFNSKTPQITNTKQTTNIDKNNSNGNVSSGLASNKLKQLSKKLSIHTNMKKNNNNKNKNNNIPNLNLDNNGTNPSSISSIASVGSSNSIVSTDTGFSLKLDMGSDIDSDSEEYDSPCSIQMDQCLRKNGIGNGENISLIPNV